MDPCGNWKRSWFERVIDEVEFLEADFTDFRYPKHVHETFAIGVIERGAQRFATKGEQLVMPSRRLCAVDPGIVHWGWPADSSGWRYRMFYPSTDVVARALDIDADAAHRIGFGFNVIDDPSLFARFENLHRHASKGPSLGLDEGMLSFIRDLFTGHAGALRPEGATSMRAATLVRAHLDDHVLEPVTVGDLAALAQVSETQVIRSFTAAFGMSPYAYSLALRVERSKRMLASNVPIVDVAHRCGFFDQPHYHRHFVKLVGCTPGQFLHATTR